MPSRSAYVAQRIGARMQDRGDQITLRRTSSISGPVPYPNPPEVSTDCAVATGVTFNGQALLGIDGSTVIGRLVAGDMVNVTVSGVVTSWLVGSMPNTYQTDSDGVVIVDNTGHPSTGTPSSYTADALAANNGWPAIPVTAVGNPAPASMIGGSVTFTYLADQIVYASTMSFQEQVALGWTEVDTIGLKIAAYNAGAIAPPKVDDLLFMLGGVRSIVAVQRMYSQSTDFIFQVQAK